MYVLGRLTAVILLSLMFLVGCSKDSTKMTDAVSDTPGSEDSTASATGEDEVLIEMGLDESSSEEEEMDLLAQTAVYFDFDQSIVKDDAQKVIRAHAEVLVQNPDVKLHLAGHADERGTREYNLALGDQRALAVSAFFQEFGVNSSRITTVSYGEEFPAVQGSDDESWELNRRVEISHDLTN